MAYMKWLDRFEVRLVYDSYASFERSVLTRLYEQLMARTKQMSMAEVFAYFDPDKDGKVERKELEAALDSLSLGLSKPQLRHLIYALGFDASEV